MRAVIFTNGELNDLEGAHALLRPDDTIIAADGGAVHCRAMGVAPALIVGDIDSLVLEDQKYWDDQGVQFIRHDRRKDETDLELALLYAQGLDREEALVLGALGNRWDQTFANILLPAYHNLEDLPVTFWHDGLWIYLVRDERTIRGRARQTVSLIPIGGDALGVTTSGLEWPLRDETLSFGATRGVSNVLLGESASVRVREGFLLCFVFTGGMYDE
ncbi:MAG: thiamine diphosphokinase [Anaerolineales bacterium]|jgi:thiamine pyrophosphokinase